MDKLEKVIKGIEFCTSTTGCTGCPYEDPCHDIEQRILGEAIMRDALELLKEKQPKWIPINERLPEEKETVLLSDGYDVLFGYMTTNRKFIFVDDALSKDDLPIKSRESWGISHWMPLPKIPKDGDRE